MRVKFEDALFDHRKIALAGKLIDKENGCAIALGFYTAAILYANKAMTDGYLEEAVIETFHHVKRPLAVADALAKAGLFERENGGWRIHDFTDYNPSASAVKKTRREDKLRKRRERATPTH
jgi:hypothetical protein